MDDAAQMMRSAFNAGAINAAKHRDTMPPEDAPRADIDAWLDAVWADSYIGKAMSEATRAPGDGE